MTRVGIRYPGYSAEDDYPRAEQLLDGPRLPLVHTEMREDAHRVDALLDIGGDEILAAGAAALPGPLDSIVWACTSGSFVLGRDGAAAHVEALGKAGKPVPTADQVSIWQGLRFARAGGPRPGFGRLFAGRRGMEGPTEEARVGGTSRWT